MADYTNNRTNNLPSVESFLEGDTITLLNGAKYIKQGDRWEPMRFSSSADEQPVTARRQGGGIAPDFDIGGKKLARYGRRKTHTIKALPGPISGSATPDTGTYAIMVASQAKFSAVRVGYIHAGGNGATAGTAMLVAATDDSGDRNFDNIGAASFKTINTPKKGGTTYNAVVTDGTPGWRRATFGGANAVAIADPGAGKQSVTWSDLMQVEGTADANGLYPLLVRVIHGSGARSYLAGPNGVQTGSQYAQDVQKLYAVATTRSGDNVTTPANWGDGNGTFTGVAPPLLIEFYAGDDVLNVMTVGDSRFGVSTELSGSKQYMSFEAYLNNAFVAAGRKAALVAQGLSGQQSSVYQPFGVAELGAGYQPDAALYLVYSINDGLPTRTIIDLAKFRAVEFVNKCRQIGALPVLFTGFPRAGGYSAAELLLLQEVRDFCNSAGALVLDPLTIYGDASGAWAAGWGFDSNHMTQAGYQDLASRVAALL